MIAQPIVVLLKCQLLIKASPENGLLIRANAGILYGFWLSSERKHYFNSGIEIVHFYLSEVCLLFEEKQLKKIITPWTYCSFF